MLYVLSTPIGNLKDITLRALEVLNNADIILCEDTRVSKKLLNHYKITNKKLVIFNEHNETQIIKKVLSWLQDNLIIVQIVDAGTPNISDPGAKLCNAILENGYPISPIPGVTAFTTLLSVSGIELPNLFLGFLPRIKSKKEELLHSLKQLNFAITIYESPHRIIETLKSINNIFGDSATLVVGRELTKQFETIKKGSIIEIKEFILNDKNQQKGEFVLIIIPTLQISTIKEEHLKTLNLLAKELPPKVACSICAKIYNISKDELYKSFIK